MTAKLPTAARPGHFLCRRKESNQRKRLFPEGATARHLDGQEDFPTRHPASTENGVHPCTPPSGSLEVTVDPAVLPARNDSQENLSWPRITEASRCNVLDLFALHQPTVAAIRQTRRAAHRDVRRFASRQDAESQNPLEPSRGELLLSRGKGPFFWLLFFGPLQRKVTRSRSE